MAATVGQLQSDCDSARTYLLAGNWSLAKRYALAADAILKALPDSELGESRVRWRTQINDLFANIRKLEADEAAASRTSGGISFGRVEHKGFGKASY